MIYDKALRIKFIIINFFPFPLLLFCKSHKTGKRQNVQVLPTFIFSASLETIWS